MANADLLKGGVTVVLLLAALAVFDSYGGSSLSGITGAQTATDQTALRVAKDVIIAPGWNIIGVDTFNKYTYNSITGAAVVSPTITVPVASDWNMIGVGVLQNAVSTTCTDLDRTAQIYNEQAHPNEEDKYDKHELTGETYKIAANVNQDEAAYIWNYGLPCSITSSPTPQPEQISPKEGWSMIGVQPGWEGKPISEAIGDCSFSEGWLFYPERSTEWAEKWTYTDDASTTFTAQDVGRGFWFYANSPCASHEAQAPSAQQLSTQVGPVSCSTLGTTMVTNSITGLGRIGCDVQVSDQIDVAGSYCQGDFTKRQAQLQLGGIAGSNGYWAALSDIAPNEVVRVFVKTTTGSTVECTPPLNAPQQQQVQEKLYTIGSDIAQIEYAGGHVWVITSDFSNGNKGEFLGTRLLKFDPNDGQVIPGSSELQGEPRVMLFDETNLWVESVISTSDNVGIIYLAKVRPSDGKVLCSVKLNSLGALGFDRKNVWSVHAEQPHVIIFTPSCMVYKTINIKNPGIRSATDRTAFDGKNMLRSMFLGGRIEVWDMAGDYVKEFSIRRPVSTAIAQNSLFVLKENNELVKLSLDEYNFKQQGPAISIGYDNNIPNHDIRDQLYTDGKDIWTVNTAQKRLYKIDASTGNVQTYDLSIAPTFLASDGTNIWAADDVGRVSKVVGLANGPFQSYK